MYVSHTTHPGQPLIVTSWEVNVAVNRHLYEVYSHWKSLCGDRPMPSRADFDPARIPRLWPFIFLVSVQDNPRDFRFRLAGTHFCDFAGGNLTGRMIDEVFPPAFLAEVRHHWGRCVDNRAPMICAGKLWVAGRDHVKWEGIVLPLSPDGGDVNMLLGSIIFG